MTLFQTTEMWTKMPKSRANKKLPFVLEEMSVNTSRTLLPGVPSKRSTLGMASPTLMGAMVLAVEDIDLTRAEENSGRDADAARTLSEIIFFPKLCEQNDRGQ